MTTMIERVARAIWNIRREEEDRCDMELEDMRKDHPVWDEARAAIEAMRELNPRLAAVVSVEWTLSPEQVGRLYRKAIDAALEIEL